MSAEEPFFSIVTVTLNCREAAVATAASVGRQSCSDYEYLVKDGGSDDGTAEAVRKLGHPVRLVEAPDQGIYDAMNQALDVCRGRYVLFLNAGDLLLHEEVLAQVRRTIQEAGEPEVVYSHYRNALRQSEVRYPPTLGRFFLYRRSLCHQVSYIRRDCYVRWGKFDLSYRTLADNEMLERILLRHQGRAHLHPHATVLYRDGGFSEQPAMRRSKPAERARMNRLYFPPGERRWYGIIMALTLKPLRERMLSDNPAGYLQQLYHRISNALNQKLG